MAGLFPGMRCRNPQRKISTTILLKQSPPLPLPLSVSLSLPFSFLSRFPRKRITRLCIDASRVLHLNKEPRTIFICRHSAIKLATQGATRWSQREILLISFFAFATYVKLDTKLIPVITPNVIVTVVEFLWPALRMSSTASVLNTNKISSVSF